MLVWKQNSNTLNSVIKFKQILHIYERYMKALNESYEHMMQSNNRNSSIQYSYQKNIKQI